jgi:hypothetical protein
MFSIILDERVEGTAIDAMLAPVILAGLARFGRLASAGGLGEVPGSLRRSLSSRGKHHQKQ